MYEKAFSNEYKQIRICNKVLVGVG